MAFARILPTQTEYSDLLKHAGKPPPLFYQGDLSLLNSECISVIGSRKMSSYGEQVVRMVVPALVQAGITIVSGLAYGVDALAHEVALQHNGRCVVVLGSGFNQIYPSRNRALFTAIVSRGGCALTQYEENEAPLPHHFRERNRIVAGLSKVVLIVEAGEKSGTLITARHALDMGREVVVVPGDITRPTSRGVFQLMQQGAYPVTSAQDILTFYGKQSAVVCLSELKPALTGSLATLYDLVSRGVNEIDHLINQSGLSVVEVQQVLSVLELDGYLYSNGVTWQRI